MFRFCVRRPVRFPILAPIGCVSTFLLFSRVALFPADRALFDPWFDWYGGSWQPLRRALAHRLIGLPVTQHWFGPISPDSAPELADSVAAAWRVLCLALHPDKHPGTDGVLFRIAGESHALLQESLREELPPIFVERPMLAL